MKEVSIGHWTNTSFIVPFYERNIEVHWGSTLVCQDLVVQSDSQCSQLKMVGWKNITVNYGRCNNLGGTLYLIDNPCLQGITIYSNSLRSIGALAISNNPVLKTVDVIGSYYWDDIPLYNVNTLNMTSSCIFHLLFKIFLIYLHSLLVKYHSIL